MLNAISPERSSPGWSRWASPSRCIRIRAAGFGPILTAERMEDPARPTVLTYGHGDTVRGLHDQWRAGLDPWTLTEEGDRWYGRGTADNKGQHALNLSALEAVLAERGGKLGFNLKLVLETSEERGSIGLREFVAAQADALAADVLIASDGPRVMPDVPTIATGTRGTFHFDLVVDLRPGGVHSGHWGGLTTDPAVVLTHALGAHHRPARENPGARLAAGERRAGERARGAGRLPGGRRRRGGDDRCRLGRARADRGGEDLRLEQLHRAGDAVGPAGEPGERGGAERAGALPDPLHGGHRSGGVRAGAARATWMPRVLPACGSRTPASACRPAAPTRRIPGSAGPWRSMERTLGRQVQVIPNAVGRAAGRRVRRSSRACRWSGFRTATTAASSTGRTSIC